MASTAEACCFFWDPFMLRHSNKPLYVFAGKRTATALLVDPTNPGAGFLFNAVFNNDVLYYVDGAALLQNLYACITPALPIVQ